MLRRSEKNGSDWPLATIYLSLFVVGLGWVGVWIIHDKHWLRRYFGGAWLGIWAPHGAAVALELFIATFVVGGLLRRHERKQLEPLTRTANYRLRLALERFFSDVTVQYGYIAPMGAEVPNNWRTLIESWTTLLPSTTQAWLPTWFREMDRLSEKLEDLRDRYERELGTATTQVIDDYLHHWCEDEGLQLRTQYADAKNSAVRFDVPDPDGKLLTVAQISWINVIVQKAASVCDRYEEAGGERLEVDPHARERFRLAQVRRTAIQKSTRSG